MDWSEYKQQIARLRSVYGDRNYPDERVMVLWGEVKEFPFFWFKKIVDRFIGESLKPPMLPEFRTEAAKERERQREKEKTDERKTGKEFLGQVYGPEEVQTIASMIKRRLQGKVDDVVWNEFMAQIDSSRFEDSLCMSCEDSGLIFKTNDSGIESVCRCKCPAGQKQPSSYPITSDDVFMRERKKNFQHKRNLNLEVVTNG
jgi:hypothetical protein